LRSFHWKLSDEKPVLSDMIDLTRLGSRDAVAGHKQAYPSVWTGDLNSGDGQRSDGGMYAGRVRTRSSSLASLDPMTKGGVGAGRKGPSGKRSQSESDLGSGVGGSPPIWGPDVSGGFNRIFPFSDATKQASHNLSPGGVSRKLLVSCQRLCPCSSRLIAHSLHIEIIDLCRKT
jgi:hypothetical protein